MLNVGLIGCGRIAQLKHLSILQQLPQVRLTALAEPDPTRAAEARAKAPAATWYADYQTLLKEADVAAVVITLPTALHAEAACAAFQAGKHLYLEKPIAVTVAEADRVLAAWQAAGTVGMTGFSFRFNREYQALRRHIQAGTVGDLIGIRSTFTTAKRPLPAWKAARQSGGGVLLDLASHHIDLLRFLLGEEIATVTATLSSRHSEADNATLHATLPSGIAMQSFFSMSSVEEHRFEVYGEGGKLVVDRLQEPGVHVIKGTQESRWQRLRHRLAPNRLRYTPDYDQPFVDALAAFAAAAATGQAAAPDLHDGYRALAVIEAAEAAAQSGQAVAVAA